jgi:hypothetical protein
MARLNPPNPTTCFPKTSKPFFISVFSIFPMNLTQLKTYAPAARNAFIKAVTRRAGVLGIHPDRVEPVIESGDVAIIGGQPFPRSIVSLRKKLVSLIESSRK